MKHMTIIGIVIGFGLAFAIIAGGFTGFLWALFLGLSGGIIGAHIEGRIDLRQIVHNISSDRGGRG